MRFAVFAALAASVFFTSGFARNETLLPVTAADGQRLILRDVTAQVTPEGVEVRGWVRRERSSYAPVSAHLHIEALGADGATLQTVDTIWQGDLPSSIRHRRAVPFQAALGGNEAARVRVSIVGGPRQEADCTR